MNRRFPEARRCSSLEAIIQFAITECAVGISWVDFFDDVAADRVSEVKAERNAVLPFVVAADVIQSREGCVAVRSSSVETEGPGLKCATACVPQVILVAQPESVDVAPDCKFLGGPQYHFGKEVRIVHGVEERKAGIDPRSGKNGKEGAMGVVRGISITAGVVVAAAKPGMNAIPKCRLPASFDCARARTLSQFTPTAVLKSTPAE